MTFTIAFLDEVDSFNPFNGFQASSYEAWAMMYDYMVGYSMEDMSPAPALAKSWETSADGKTWTFDIREGVTWSDGEPLTAADIAYTYNRILDGGPEAGNWGTYLTSVETVTAPDDTTVVLELARPNAVLPLLPIPILPEHVWSDVAEDDVKSYRNEPTDGEPVVGSGRFRLVEGTAGGSTYVFEANPDYWDGVPHVDRVAIRVYKSEDPAIQALIKGEVDFVDDITPVQVEALQGRDGIHAQNGISPYFEEIAFNIGAVDPDTGEPLGDGNPALEDPAFRHALGYALDVDRLVETAYQGAAVPGDTFIPTAYESYRWEPPEDEAFSFDLEKAGELLDEAGYEVGPDGLRTMPDGSPIGALRLFARAEEERSATIMEFFQEWLGEIGIESEVRVMESNQLTDVILEGDFDAFHWGWFVEPDPDSILSVFLCDARGGSSDSWYCNEEFDELYAAAERRGRRREADRDDQGDAGDHLPRLALPRHGVHEVRPGPPYRPVRVLPAAAGPRRGAARAVRRLQLQPAPPGRRGRRLRRHRLRDPGRLDLVVVRGRRGRQHRPPGRAGRRGPAAAGRGRGDHGPTPGDGRGEGVTGR